MSQNLISGPDQIGGKEEHNDESSELDDEDDVFLHYTSSKDAKVCTKKTEIYGQQSKTMNVLKKVRFFNVKSGDDVKFQGSCI